MTTGEPFPDHEAADDLNRVRYVTQSLDRFLGLYLVPPGLAVILVGLANILPSGTLNPWLMVAALVVGVGSWAAVRQHYHQVVGRVERRTSHREIRQGLLAAGLLLGGALLDTFLDPGISLMLLLLAAGFLTKAIPCGGLYRQFAVVLTAAAVLSGTAWWSDNTAGGMATIFLGVAYVAAGIMSHRELDEALSPVGAGRS